jgi:hypothetical protein
MTQVRMSFFQSLKVVLFFAITMLIGTAQTTCPTVSQINGLNGQPNAGIQNGANVTIEVVGSTLQAGDPQITAGANDWTTIPGATYTFTIQNVDSVQSGNATAGNPVVIFQIGPASDFAPGAGCEGAFMCTQPSSLDANGHVLITQVELNPANTTSNTFFQVGFEHELGHGLFGLGDCDGCDTTQTIMASPVTTSTDPGPSTCDSGYLYRNSSGAYGTSSGGGGGGGGGGVGGLCPGGFRAVQDGGCNPSPIIMDTEGEGFHLTSADAGVMFDIAGNGNPIQIAWTDPRYHNAFLGLPGSDGLIHNGMQLFGNFTPQPSSDNPNGFIALAQYDKPEDGGNGDGLIDERDAIFSRLRLWIDENHDGICQPNELHSLLEMGVHSLALDYIRSDRKDQCGNQFRYRSKVNPTGDLDFRDERQHDGEVGRWAYDVFFATK